MTILWQNGGDSPLAQELRKEYRVVSGPDPQASGEFVIIAQSNDATEALARAKTPSCTALILLAPVFEPMPAPEEAADVPTLVLLGTNDAQVPPGAANALCGALPRAHPILIYGAGHDLVSERVEAVSAVIRDFIVHRDDFVVRTASDILYP